MSSRIWGKEEQQILLDLQSCEERRMRNQTTKDHNVEAFLFNICLLVIRKSEIRYHAVAFYVSLK